MAEAEATGQKEEKKKSTLESVISELGSFARKALIFGSLVAMPLLYLPLSPAHVPRAAATVAGFSAGQMVGNMARNESATKGVFRQGVTGNVLSAPLAVGFRAMNNLETVVEASYGPAVAKTAKVGTLLGIHQPTISTMRTAMDYGLGKNFRKYWWTGVKNTFYTLGMFGVVNVLYVYQFGLLAQMIYTGAASFVFRVVNSIKELGGSLKNLYSRLNPVPYVKATANVTYKLARNSVGGLYEAAYAIGSGLKDTLYEPTPKQPEKKPAEAPAKA